MGPANNHIKLCRTSGSESEMFLYAQLFQLNFCVASSCVAYLYLYLFIGDANTYNRNNRKFCLNMNATCMGMFHNTSIQLRSACC